MTTNANLNFLLSNFAPVVEGSDGVNYRDYDNNQIVEMFRALQFYYSYDWSDDDQITTLTYRLMGNTTQFWMIQLFNGFLDQLEIDGGSSLHLPVPNELTSTIQSTGPIGSTNKVGQQVLI